MDITKCCLSATWCNSMSTTWSTVSIQVPTVLNRSSLYPQKNLKSEKTRLQVWSKLSIQPWPRSPPIKMRPRPLKQVSNLEKYLVRSLMMYHLVHIWYSQLLFRQWTLRPSRGPRARYHSWIWLALSAMTNRMPLLTGWRKVPRSTRVSLHSELLFRDSQGENLLIIFHTEIIS